MGVREFFVMTEMFDVVRRFEATEAICDRKHRFELGDVVTCDSGQTGPTLTIEADTILFLVDRAIFKACCEWKNGGASAGGF
jgi:hypothetical protein